MNNFSATQATNWLAFSGLIVVVLKLFGLSVAEGDVQTVIGAVIAIIGVVLNYIHRQNTGDLTPLGFRKFPKA
jgi:hypothetical protein